MKIQKSLKSMFEQLDEEEVAPIDVTSIEPEQLEEIDLKKIRGGNRLSIASYHR